MQQAILTKTPNFDIGAFLAGPFHDQRIRSAGGGTLRGSVSSSASERVASGAASASWSWLAKLHLSAARRWLSHSPVRLDQIEVSIREIAAACASTHPLLASELSARASQMSAAGSVAGLLDRVERLLSADEI